MIWWGSWSLSSRSILAGCRTSGSDKALGDSCHCRASRTDQLMSFPKRPRTSAPEDSGRLPILGQTFRTQSIEHGLPLPLSSGCCWRDTPLGSPVPPSPPGSFGKRQSAIDFRKTAASRQDSFGCTQAIPLVLPKREDRRGRSWRRSSHVLRNAPASRR